MNSKQIRAGNHKGRMELKARQKREKRMIELYPGGRKISKYLNIGIGKATFRRLITGVVVKNSETGELQMEFTTSPLS